MHRISWDEYEFSGRAPDFSGGYPTPKEEDQLLDSSAFLKRQVRRQMRRIRAQVAKNKKAGQPSKKVFLTGRRAL